MQLPVKILLINVGIALILSFIFSFDNLHYYFTSLGLTSLVISFIDLILGLVLLAMRDKRYSQGFLLSCGVLGLSGFLTCSMGTAISFH